MSAYVVEGGRRINGQIKVQGSKNSALPIMAATLLVEGKCILHNCPKLSDIDCTIKILRLLGCKVYREKSTVFIDAENISEYKIPDELMRELRSSIVFLGAILGRLGRASVSKPGGCEIGLRPIDLHLYAVKKLGVKIEDDFGVLNCFGENLTGNKITFSFPSVGATENAVLTAVRARGETTIVNAAREPEIIDLCNFLNSCGAEIKGAGESVIKINGVKKLHPSEYTIMCDRIAAATYLASAAVTGGSIKILNAEPQYLNSVLPYFEEAGCDLRVRCNEIYLKAPLVLNRIDKIITQPYPGFPTDAQAVFGAVASICKGTSVIVENIFESRFKYVSELLRMGAKIKIEGRVAVIEGVERLYGAKVISPDLRGGAALVLASLSAEGQSLIENIEYIDRGYEEFENNLCLLNADVRRKVK